MKTKSAPLQGITFEDIISENEKELMIDEKSTNGKIDSEISTFEIIKNYGKLSSKKTAPSFTLVDWNGYIRYDIRKWNEDYSKPFKGISLSKDDIVVLKDHLANFNLPLLTDIQYVYESGPAKACIYAVVCNFSSSEIKGTLWNKQLCIVDWGYGQKLDFRKWTQDYRKCSKGIGLNKSEIEMLKSILDELDIELAR